MRKAFLVSALLIAAALCTPPVYADAILWPVFAGIFLVGGLLCAGVAILAIAILVRAVKKLRAKRQLQQAQAGEENENENEYETDSE